MSLADTRRGRRNRIDPGVDPAYAFGAEEQVMDEIRRQNFVPPERKGPGVAARAGAALNSLRQKLSGGDDPAFDGFGEDYREEPPRPRQEAPTYSAETYDQPAAPDMGWENPFTSPAPKKSKPKASPPRQTRPVREQAAPPPVYEDYYGGYYAQGGYEPYPQEPAYPPENAYTPPAQEWGQPPAYAPYPPEAYAPPRQAYYPPEGYYPDPVMGDPYADPAYYGGQPYSAEYRPGARGWYGQDNIPRRTRQRKRMKPGDLKYYFWSCSIVTGMVLTVVAFIYGCIV